MTVKRAVPTAKLPLATLPPIGIGRIETQNEKTPFRGSATRSPSAALPTLSRLVIGRVR